MRADTVVILDLDGTLVDAFEDIMNAVNAPLRARGLPTHAIGAVRGMVGSGIVELCRRAAPMLAGPEAEAYLAEVRAAYAMHPVVHAQPYEGVMEMLRELRASSPTAVLSNKPHPATLEVCRRLGIATLVDAIEGEDPPRIPRKPDPAGARALMARLGAAHAIVLGDMPPDGMLARALGAPFLGALWSGTTAAELRPLDPVALCAHPREVPSHVRRILAAGNPTTAEPTQT